MNRLTRCVAGLVFLIVSLAANAQVNATYSFTGVITEAGANQQFHVGQYIVGTYKINYNNSADTSIGGRTFASGSHGIPYNPALFSSMTVGGQPAYTTISGGFDSDPDNSSVVAGDTNGVFFASEAVPADDMTSFLLVTETALTVQPPSLNGLTTTEEAKGGYSFLVPAYAVRFTITSLTLAPGPAPADVLATLLANVTGARLNKDLEREVQSAQNDNLRGDVSGACHALARFLDGLPEKGDHGIDKTLHVTLTRGAQTAAAKIGC